MVAVIELSNASWLVAGTLPGVARRPLKKLDPDPAALKHLLTRWRVEAETAGRSISRMIVAYEAGRDGFGVCCTYPGRGRRWSPLAFTETLRVEPNGSVRAHCRLCATFVQRPSIAGAVMAVTRIVANLPTPDPMGLTRFYREVFELDLYFEMGWIAFLRAHPSRSWWGLDREFPIQGFLSIALKLNGGTSVLQSVRPGPAKRFDMRHSSVSLVACPEGRRCGTWVSICNDQGNGKKGSIL